jgi:hypothetical protein
MEKAAGKVVRSAQVRLIGDLWLSVVRCTGLEMLFQGSVPCRHGALPASSEKRIKVLKDSSKGEFGVLPASSRLIHPFRQVPEGITANRRPENGIGSDGFLSDTVLAS